MLKQDAHEVQSALAIHAGGFVMGKRDQISPHWIEELHDRDFVVVSIDHRMCPQVTLWDGPIQDTRDAYHWCRNKLPEILKTEAGLDIDGSRIVALGWSAGGHLSMMMGGETEKPCAILNCYGPLYFKDPSYRKPVNKIMPGLEGKLEFDPEFTKKVFDEPVQTFTENIIIINAKGQPEINFSEPRNAWHFENIHRGVFMKALGLEGNEDKIDPALLIDKDFPPICFEWGDEDEICDVRLARDAYEKLKGLGVDTELVVAKGYGHAFGPGLVKGTEDYQKLVIEPLDFLKKHADKA